MFFVVKPRFNIPVQTLHCPLCGQSFDADTTPAMPFCSERCRLLDLGRWLDEEYSVPHEPDEDELEELAE